MIKDQILMWLQEGNVLVPSFLFVHYVEMGLNEQELILLLQIQQYQKEGKFFPTPDELSERMTITSHECSNLLGKLMRTGFLEIKEEVLENHMHSEIYSLVPMQRKMVEYFLLKQNKENETNKQSEEINLYSIFEQEFGRPLSPIECETLGMWMDDDFHDSKIILAALKEAVISGKLNFRYIDRILFEWKKNGIKTVDQARVYSEKFRTHQRREQQQQPKSAVKNVPFYNWLEN